MTVLVAGSWERAEALLHTCCVVCLQQLLGHSRAASMLCMESEPVDIMPETPSLSACSLCEMLAEEAVHPQVAFSEDTMSAAWLLLCCTSPSSEAHNVSIASIMAM